MVSLYNLNHIQKHNSMAICSFNTLPDVIPIFFSTIKVSSRTETKEERQKSAHGCE